MIRPHCFKHSNRIQQANLRPGNKASGLRYFIGTSDKKTERRLWNVSEQGNAVSNFVYARLTNFALFHCQTTRCRFGEDTTQCICDLAHCAQRTCSVCEQVSFMWYVLAELYMEQMVQIVSTSRPIFRYVIEVVTHQKNPESKILFIRDMMRYAKYTAHPIK